MRIGTRSIPTLSHALDEAPKSTIASLIPNYDVASDGRFLMIRGIAPATTDTRIAVLLHWEVPK